MHEACNPLILTVPVDGIEPPTLGTPGHFDGAESFCQSADLVQFDEYGIGDPLLESSLKILELVTKMSPPTSFQPDFRMETI